MVMYIAPMTRTVPDAPHVLESENSLSKIKGVLFYYVGKNSPKHIQGSSFVKMFFITL